MKFLSNMRLAKKLRVATICMVAMLAGVVVRSLPDLARYLRIREM